MLPLGVAISSKLAVVATWLWFLLPISSLPLQMCFLLLVLTTVYTFLTIWLGDPGYLTISYQVRCPNPPMASHCMCRINAGR
jgi:hypothetical protein